MDWVISLQRLRKSLGVEKNIGTVVDSIKKRTKSEIPAFSIVKKVKSHLIRT